MMENVMSEGDMFDVRPATFGNSSGSERAEHGQTEACFTRVIKYLLANWNCDKWQSIEVDS